MVGQMRPRTLLRTELFNSKVALRSTTQLHDLLPNEHVDERTSNNDLQSTSFG